MADKTYKWTVEIEVDPMWVADGFNITPARLEDMIASQLGYARPDEYQGKVLSAPDPKQIRAEQGYKEPGYKPYIKDDEPCPKCGDLMEYEDETACGQRCQKCQEEDE